MTAAAVVHRQKAGQQCDEPVDLTPTLPPFTVQESAPLLNVSPDAIYDAIGRGEIHALRLGRLIRIPRREIARLLGLTDSESAVSA